MAVTDIDR